ncbi:hypothetical protein KSP40_PGU004976 [Platanthera guangdongensis]|uniref:Uncharacterized protein n=1 Tax=Platanthera guangdongensis TaxID=2320717 RepID=A0ABR2M3Z1_9ASPA
MALIPDTFSTLDLIPGDKVEFLLLIAPVKESYDLACKAFKAAEKCKIALKVCIIWPHDSSTTSTLSGSGTNLQPWTNYVDVQEVDKGGTSPSRSPSWWGMCGLSSNGIVLVRPDDHIAWTTESHNVNEDSATVLERVEGIHTELLAQETVYTIEISESKKEAVDVGDQSSEYMRADSEIRQDTRKEDEYANTVAFFKRAALAVTYTENKLQGIRLKQNDIIENQNIIPDNMEMVHNVYKILMEIHKTTLERRMDACTQYLDDRMLEVKNHATKGVNFLDEKISLDKNSLTTTMSEEVIKGEKQ